ncbi:MAG: hypothetical protein ACRDKZ_15045 [Actinomycetota bacterium]
MDQLDRTPARDRLAIDTRCPKCGRIDVPFRNIHLWIERDGLSTYSFICPGCCRLVRMPADLGTLGVLFAAAPPLGHEDLHLFRGQLERDDWFERLERRPGPAPESPCGGTTSRLQRAWSGAARALTRGLGQRHHLRAS